MKKVFFLVAFSLACSFSYLQAQDIAEISSNATSKANSTALVWDKTVNDFGKIPQGIPAEVEFKLTNNSKEVLLITEVKSTCGCTVAGFSQDPILPGESTSITATYNAKKEGPFNKTIKVYTNQNDNFIPLQLKGEVIIEKN